MMEAQSFAANQVPVLVGCHEQENTDYVSSTPDGQGILAGNLHGICTPAIP